MKAKELRIGNWVIINTEFCMDYSAMHDSYLDNDWEDLKPIPLTEDILLKCGFYSLNDSCSYRIKILKRNVLFYLTVFLKYDTDGTEVWGYNHCDLTQVDSLETGGCNIPNDIDYLHQLQNLYFALTGNELNVTKLKQIKAMPQSEDKIILDRLASEIVHLESFIESLDIQLTVKRAKLSLLKERKKSLLNYLNDEN